MNINWNEFERGFNGSAKEANFIGDFAGNFLSKYIQKPIGGGSNIAEGIPLFGGVQNNENPLSKIPRIRVNTGPSKTVFSTPPTQVASLANPVKGVNKLAGLIDPNVLRSVLTAKAVKGIVNTVTDQDGNTIPAEEHKDVILESKYPEMKKLLADPSTKAYLESLLTEDSNNAR
jgi:hypothetical protein